MSYSLNFLKGVIWDYIGSIAGVIRGDARRLASLTSDPLSKVRLFRGTSRRSGWRGLPIAIPVKLGVKGLV